MNKTTKNNITELVFILDRSGSMSGLEADTVGGFNSMLKKQKETDGTAYVTTVLFNHESKTLHDRLAVQNVSEMAVRDFDVSGCTALYDAIGQTIEHIESIHKYARPEDVPEKTVFVITTDGMENASSRFTRERVKALIEKQKKAAGWEFLFIAANIDAADTASGVGIDEDHAVNYHADACGTSVMFESVSDTLCCMRECDAPLSPGWKKKIEADFKKR